jgi:hypothetical protein
LHGQINGFISTRGLTHHLHILTAIEQSPDSGSHDLVIINQ